MGNFVLDKAELEALYTGQKLTVQQIADQHGATWAHVAARMDQVGIPRRSVAEIRRMQDMTGKRNPNWRRGSMISDHGYRIIHSDGKRQYEHRLVMEAVLGRPLTRDEIVHHKNGDKLDNRPANLELIGNTAHIRLHARQLTEQGISRHSDLTAADVESIRMRRSKGVRLSVMAEEFGITASSLSAMTMGKTWTSVAGPIKKRKPLFCLAMGLRLQELGLDRFTSSDTEVIRALSEAEGKPYRGAADVHRVAEAIAGHIAKGGKLWRIDHQINASAPAKRKQRVFVLQLGEIEIAQAAWRCTSQGMLG